MKILIKVTKDVLKKSSMCGTVANDITTNCAIALAVRDIFPNALVNFKSIFFYGESSYAVPMFGMETKLPEKANEFISEFDASSPSERIYMDEISFEIDIPKNVIEKIGIGEVYKVLSESRTLELVHP